MGKKKKPSKKKSFQKELKNNWKHCSFRFLVITSFLLILDMFFFKKLPHLVSFIAITLWLISYLSHERINKKIWNKKEMYDRRYFWFLFLIMFSFDILLGFITFGKGSQFSLNSMAILIIAGFFVLILTLISWQSKSLYSLKNGIRGIVLNYIFLSLLIIILFSTLYVISPGENCGIYDTSNNSITQEVDDLLYFSSGTFYAISYGDIIPKCNISRLASQLEVGISFILHVIILSHLLTRLPKEKKKRKKRKNLKKRGL
jgi:hypothetical protein